MVYEGTDWTGTSGRLLQTQLHSVSWRQEVLYAATSFPRQILLPAVSYTRHHYCPVGQIHTKERTHTSNKSCPILIPVCQANLYTRQKDRSVDICIPTVLGKNQQHFDWFSTRSWGNVIWLKYHTSSGAACPSSPPDSRNFDNPSNVLSPLYWITWRRTRLTVESQICCAFRRTYTITNKIQCLMRILRIQSKKDVYQY